MNEAWRIFCLPIAIVTGTGFLSNTSVAVQAVSEPEIFHIKGFIFEGRSGCPGAKTITKLSWV
jgi:hypothetical protein